MRRSVIGSLRRTPLVVHGGLLAANLILCGTLLGQLAFRRADTAAAAGAAANGSTLSPVGARVPACEEVQCKCKCECKRQNSSASLQRRLEKKKERAAPATAPGNACVGTVTIGKYKRSNCDSVWGGDQRWCTVVEGCTLQTRAGLVMEHTCAGTVKVGKHKGLDCDGAWGGDQKWCAITQGCKQEMRTESKPIGWYLPPTTPRAQLHAAPSQSHSLPTRALGERREKRGERQEARDERREASGERREREACAR